MHTESVMKNATRTFFKSLFAVIGFAVGVLIVMVLFSLLFSSTAEKPHSTTLRVLPDDQWKISDFSREAPSILRINIDGVIGLDHIRKEDIMQQLIESQEGELKAGQVKGLLLYINTPGGTADDSDAIYRMIKEYKRRYKVPVVAYVDGMCASGGTYIACAADKVYATKDSLVGHVGVLLSPPFFNFTKLMDKLGIESKTFFAGKDKDAMNPFRPWQQGEGENYQRLVSYMYDRFKTIVSENRPKLTVEVLTEEGAQIYPAPVAKEKGYIDDEVNSIDELLAEFATELGIYEDYQFVALEKHDFFVDLFGVKAKALFSKDNEFRVRLPGDLHPDLYGKPLYLYHPYE
ncbi:MAG: S49 family peptidase [Verrucomicrobia bacterium]|nr:S49 family peptidase [Verrucomicrobiota bacterium]MBS0637042.1 S49 family peptidase [Verrucomicrobiota bacterium]